MLGCRDCPRLARASYPLWERSPHAQFVQTFNVLKEPRAGASSYFFCISGAPPSSTSSAVHSLLETEMNATSQFSKYTKAQQMEHDAKLMPKGCWGRRLKSSKEEAADGTHWFRTSVWGLASIGAHTPIFTLHIKIMPCNTSLSSFQDTHHPLHSVLASPVPFPSLFWVNQAWDRKGRQGHYGALGCRFMTLWKGEKSQLKASTLKEK